MVGAETLLVICSADHPLAGKRIRTAQQLAGRTVGRFPGGARARIVRARFSSGSSPSAGLDGATVTLIDSLTAQKRLVEAGFGIALVPESSVRDELRLGAVKVLNAPDVRTTVPFSVIHRRKGYLSPAAARAALVDEPCNAAAQRRTGEKRIPQERKESSSAGARAAGRAPWATA